MVARPPYVFLIEVFFLIKKVLLEKYNSFLNQNELFLKNKTMKALECAHAYMRMCAHTRACVRMHVSRNYDRQVSLC